MTTNRGSRPSWMWRALAFALVLWVAPRAHAQQAAPEAQVYRFTKDTNIKRCTQDGAAVAGAPPEVADEGWRYYVIGRPAGQLVIQFLPWRTTSKAAADIAAIRAKNAKYRVQAVGAGRELMSWCIASSEELASTQKYYLGSSKPDANFGALVVPIKLRGGAGERRQVTFTTDVSLAGAIDINWKGRGTTPWFLHGLIFAGIAAIQITPNESALETTRMVPAFTTGIGIGVSGAYGGAGLVMGLDVVNGNTRGEDAIRWDYQGRPWLGISIGTTFGVPAKADPGAQSSS